MSNEQDVESAPQPVFVGARCTDDDCDWTLGTDDPARSWDIVERLRMDHEDETGHQVTVECIHEQRILPGEGDRMKVGDYVLDVADDEILWICPECERTGEELETTKRCPNCDERLREVLP